ncbi:two-component-system connector protein YcgZ [Paramixta manurensis]|uniref:Two-component-system connector protein YcgZ n=1 Tax=Paramixta manurensis TaxID=2740817 RepID=A0A6M8ULG1_9GAMM|nr:two-component-system connector protein YcgZ [Erwiniaceae bacterium PD-1]
MRQGNFNPKTEREIALYFSQAENGVPGKEDTLGQVVMEILRAGKSVNRKTICSKLLVRLEQAADEEMEKHYHELIAMLFGRED